MLVYYVHALRKIEIYLVAEIMIIIIYNVEFFLKKNIFFYGNLNNIYIIPAPFTSYNQMHQLW